MSIDGPRVRLGLAWFVLLVAAVAAGAWWLAAPLALAAAVAGAQAGRTWRRRDQQVMLPVAILGAAGIAIAPVAGVAALAGAVGAVVAVAFAWEPVRAIAGRFDARSRTSALRTVGVAVPIGLAAASVVWVRHRGVTHALVLITMAYVHDAANYIVGSGAAHAWEGPVAAAAAIGAVALSVAAVLVPPFRGVSPWVLGGLAAVLAPVGPYAGTALLGDRTASAPALRRLDVLLVLGPVWAVSARVLTTS